MTGHLTSCRDTLSLTCGKELQMFFYTDDDFVYSVYKKFESTTPTATPSSSSTERPVQPTLPADPLPVSGQLLTPVTSVDRLCPCDEHKDVCDINCCCDRECREEVALFTGCSVDSVSGNKQLCSRDVASYSLWITVDGYSELQSSVKKETNYDAFCIQSQNEDSSGQVLSAKLQGVSGYQYGDVMVTTGGRGQRGTFWLPAPGVTAHCMDTSAAAFLKDQSSQCSRHVVLEQDCSTLPALSMDTYTNIQLFAVVPVEVTSVILQSVDGTQTELQISDGENLNPVLLNPALCANVVLKVVYVMKYNPAGEIVKAMVSLVLGLEDVANCSLVFQALLGVLRGPNYPQYVASFGNSPLEYPLDWVPIKNNSIPGEAQSCIIPLSLHLEIEWTKYGSLVNPQAQIVSVKEVIQTNITSLDQLSGGSSTVSITSSVAFIPVSAAALPGYRAMPTIDAKLPFDFFFPFV
ncbi:Tectonic-1 [Nibea albiflora]|uniref:Tectonic-1 n=1 Tax=Nibea albiflora TaxID=240163 RepID=A0ACB7ENK5_NIBAL|nr:Tectonic-1 [Nibea albiflora]